MPENNQMMSVEGQLVGMPLAGPESFSQQQLEYLKRALGVDETVLWEGAHVMSSNPSITLSESAANFKYVDIYSLPHNTNSIAIITRIYTETLNGVPTADGSFTIIGHAAGGGFRINNAWLKIVDYTTMTFTEQKQSSIVGTGVSTANTANTIFKIVGVHRIAGGNQ